MKRYQPVYPFVLLLTIADMMFTAKGLKLGTITEANPVVDYFLGLSAELTLVCIPIFVGAVLLLLYRFRRQVRWLNTAVTGLAVIKLYILLLHIKWVSGYIMLNCLLF